MTTTKHPAIATKPVKSSQIKAIGHCGDTNTLCVEFSGGGCYHYAGVSADDYDKLMKAESVGSHFGKHIKAGGFKFTKINQEKK